MVTFVYILSQGSAHRPVKVGRTRDPLRRAKDIGKALGGTARILRLYAGSDDAEAHVVEQNAHHRLRERALGGEWFDVPAIEAARAIVGVIETRRRRGVLLGRFITAVPPSRPEIDFARMALSRPCNIGYLKNSGRALIAPDGVTSLVAPSSRFALAGGSR